MAILGKDVFPIHEPSQHEKALQSIFSSLDTIGQRMSDNRAEPMEVLLYQTSLLYHAIQGGQIGLEKNDPRIPAFDMADSLAKYARDDDDPEDFPYFEELPFLSPQYSAEVYSEAFHLLFEEKYHICIPISGDDVFLVPETEELVKQSRNYVSFLSSLYSPGIRVLDFDARYLPPGFRPDIFERYVILEQDALLRAFLILRKEIEGDSWRNVTIIDDLPTVDEKFASIIMNVNGFRWDLTLEGLSGLLAENGHLLLRGQPLSQGNRSLAPIQYNDLYNSGMLEAVIALVEIGEERKELFILKKGRIQENPVTFVDLGNESQTKELLGQFNMETLSNLSPEHIVSLSMDEILPSNLHPGYYLTLRDTQKAGTAPLSKFIGSVLPKELVDLDNNDEVVMKVTTDSRILESTVDKTRHPKLGFYSVSIPCILIQKYEGAVGYVSPENGQALMLNRHIAAYPINPQTADIRYLVLQLRRTIKSYWKLYWRDDDLLRYHIPDLSLTEQQEYVKNYLRDLRNDFNSQIDIKDSTLQILVYTSNKADFEATNKEKMDKLGFKVLKYVEDKNSLKGALSEHYGEKVLSSELADAVLVCADMPANDVEKAIYFIEKTGIRVFYYSDSPSYDFDKIDEDYLDDFKKGFISDKDYLEIIREKMDADSNKVRDQYSKFFKAADRLDEDYGWGLAEYATSLLQGKPFKMDINKLRSKIDETIITFFKSHHIAPAEMDNTAVASLVADKKYYEGRKKVNINLTEELSKTALDAEAWYKYALVAIRKLGNKDSHSSSDSDSSLELAAFTLFTEIIVWLDSVRERYKEKKCLFVIKKGNVELPFYTVEEYQVDGKDYLVANGVHLIDTKRELKAGDQVVILDTEAEKYPRTINGSRVEEVASPTNYIVAIKA